MKTTKPPVPPKDKHIVFGCKHEVTSFGFRRLFEAQLAASPDNPKLLLLISDRCIKNGDYARAAILLGRAAKLGVRTFKVYSQRGFCLLKLAETECLQYPEVGMTKFIDSGVAYDKAITLGVLSGQATVPILLHAARSFFRAGSYEQATRLCSHLVESLPTSNSPEELIEVCLMASQSLYALNQLNTSIEYMRHVFNKVHSVHLLKRKRRTGSYSGDIRNDDDRLDDSDDSDDSDDLDDSDDSDDDIGDVLVKRHGVINESVCALVLGLLIKFKDNKQAADSDLDLKTAVQYSFFRHRAASLVSKTLTNTENNVVHNMNMEQSNPLRWSQDPYPWIAAGDNCIKRGQPVFACLCYQEATQRAHHIDTAKPWHQSLETRLKTPSFALALTKYSLSLMLSNKKDQAVHAAHCSLQHFRWQLATRNLLLKWEPRSWKHLFSLQSTAAVVLQRRVRGMIVRSTSNTDRAARMFQSIWRMLKVKIIFIRKRKAAIRIQTCWRGVAERMGVVWRRKRKMEASINIQRIFRGHYGRIKARLQLYLRFESAYNLLLKIGRGHIGRQRWKDRLLAIIRLQSMWRGYECRLTMWAIGVLPLIRWTQIGSCFVPITYIRREPTFHVNPDQTDGGKKMLLLANAPLGKRMVDAEFVPAEDIDLTVAGRRLIPNVQLDSIHNATIMSRIQKIDTLNTLQINRANLFHDQLQQERVLIATETPDILAMKDTMREQQDADIQEYLKSTAKVKDFLQTAEMEMDRAKRRLKSITSTWLNTFAMCLNDLNQYGHQPLTFWRARVQLHLEAAKNDLITTYGKLPTRDILRVINNIHADMNLLSANETRSRMNVLIKMGEHFERKANRQWRTLDDEFRGARKRLRHAVKAALALKRRVKRLNDERNQKRNQLLQLMEEIEHDNKFGVHSNEQNNIVHDGIVLEGAVDEQISGHQFGAVLVNDVAKKCGENAAAAETNTAISLDDLEEDAFLQAPSFSQLHLTADEQPATDAGDTTNSAILTPSLPSRSTNPIRTHDDGGSTMAVKQTCVTQQSMDHSMDMLQSTTVLLDHAVPETISKKEMALRKRCDILLHRQRTRSNFDHLLAEWKRLLARCAFIGAWRLSLEVHICMAKQNLPRDEATYRNVVTSVKRAKHKVPSQVIVAILDEMIEEGMTNQRTFHVCMGALGRDKAGWRHVVVTFQKMRKAGHKATSASYEILSIACSDADPTDCYDALKFAGVPEFFAYSIGRRSRKLLD
jgi:hypothetical protein